MIGIRKNASLASSLLLMACMEQGPQAQRIGQDQLAIVEDAKVSTSGERARSFREFEPAAGCSARRKGVTIAAILGSEAKSLIVHNYDKQRWPDFEVVKDYLHRVLNGVPEGGIVSTGIYWAEYRQVEMIASVEFMNGQRSRAEFANGYAHVEDLAGCQWWARYLGPDRSRWIVRR